MPPKGTAGLARSRVSGPSRAPLPPARTTAKTSFIVFFLERANQSKKAGHAIVQRASAYLNESFYRKVLAKTTLMRLRYDCCSVWPPLLHHRIEGREAKGSRPR